MDKLQISNEWGQKAFPIDIEKLPENVVESIDTDDMYPLMTYSKENGMEEILAVFFRKVEKFRKGIKEIEVPGKDIVFGV